MKTPRYTFLSQENTEDPSSDKKEARKVFSAIFKKISLENSPRCLILEDEANGEKLRENLVHHCLSSPSSHGMFEPQEIYFLYHKDVSGKESEYADVRKKLSFVDFGHDSCYLLQEKLGGLALGAMSQVIALVAGRALASELLSQIMRGVKHVLPRTHDDRDFLSKLYKIFVDLQRQPFPVLFLTVGEQAASGDKDKASLQRYLHGTSEAKNANFLTFAGDSYTQPLHLDEIISTRYSDMDSDVETACSYQQERNDSRTEDGNEVIEKRYSQKGKKKSRQRKMSVPFHSIGECSEHRSTGMDGVCVTVDSATKSIVEHSGSAISSGLQSFLAELEDEIVNAKHHSQDPHDIKSFEKVRIDKNSGERCLRNDPDPAPGRKAVRGGRPGLESEAQHLTNNEQGRATERRHGPDMLLLINPLGKHACFAPSEIRLERELDPHGTAGNTRRLQTGRKTILEGTGGSTTGMDCRTSPGRPSDSAGPDPAVQDGRTSATDMRIGVLSKDFSKTSGSSQIQPAHGNLHSLCGAGPTPAAAADVYQRNKDSPSELNDSTTQEEEEGEDRHEEDERMTYGDGEHRRCGIIAQPNTESEMSDTEDDELMAHGGGVRTELGDTPTQDTVSALPVPCQEDTVLETSSSSGDGATAVRIIAPVQESLQVTAEFSEYSEFFFDDVNEFSDMSPVLSVQAERVRQSDSREVVVDTALRNRAEPYSQQLPVNQPIGVADSTARAGTRDLCCADGVQDGDHSVRSATSVPYTYDREAAAAEDFRHSHQPTASSSLPSVPQTASFSQSEPGPDPYPAQVQRLPPITVHAAGAVPPWATKNPRLDLTQAASRPHANLLTRRATFHRGWPEGSTQDPATLALAGFYYEGQGRSLRCWWCGVVVDDLCPAADPWEEHLRLSPSCQYLVEMRGADFITRAQGRFQDKDQL